MRTRVMVGILACACLATPGWAKTVGLLKDAKSGITDGMLKTLDEAGWKTVILTNRGEWASEESLASLDVVFLPGGHNSTLGGFKNRRALVSYVAGGKGILAGAFRGGYARTADRPLFPQVGEVYNKANGAYMIAYGDSDLAKAIDQPFCPGGWDHTVVKLGPLGKEFAASAGDNEPVGVYGDVYGGRYLLFGAFIGSDARTNAMEGTARTTLLAMLDWLAAAPKLTDADKTMHQAEADLDFLRREKLTDWTLHERGPDSAPGILPAIRNRLAFDLQSRQYTLRYMAQFLSGKQAEQCRASEDELEKAVETLDAQYRKTLAEVAARIGRMTVEELTAEKPLFDKESFSDQFLPAARLKEVSDRADQAIAGFWPQVKAAKAAKAAAARKQDLAAVPGLIAQSAAPDAAVRLEAVKELGRIGSADAAPVLIRLLTDADPDVQVNAILALGWMQAKEAVPGLIALARGDNLRLRRRAVQALGQIGDPRAVKPLLGLIADPDFFTSENAILALGWLKAQDAVPELLKLVTTSDRQNGDQRSRMTSAIRSLGHIGDPAALPVLEDLAKTANDFPMTKKNKRVNIYSSMQAFGLQCYAELAAAEIKGGGLSEPGIRQAEFLAERDKFHGLTRSFNALAGRAHIFGEDVMPRLWPWLWEAGMTGIHSAWGDNSMDVDKMVAAIRAADDFDLRWINVLPLDVGVWGQTSFGKNFYKSYRPDSTADKNALETVLMKFRDEPAFRGFWAEEGYPTIASAAGFEEWLKRKYGADFREKLGIAEGQNPMDLATKESRGPVRVEFLLYAADNLLEYWREDQEWMNGFRKGCAFTWSESDGRPIGAPGVSGKLGSVIAINGPESYQSFGRRNAFLMEMFKNGEARPVMAEFYNWMSPGPANDVRGFAQHLMHGECFYNFSLSQIFEHASNYPLWTWDATRWDNMRKMFQKARTIKDYLAVPESAANVALVLSELSAAPFYPSTGGQMENRWVQHQVALWTAFNQSQIPTDLIWAETLTPEKLDRYNVLMLADAKIITAEQAGLLRQWVANGGVLIATGTTSLFDPSMAQRANYLLADLFGAAYTAHIGVDDPEKIDTTCLQQRQATAAKVVSGLDPANFQHLVHRAVKPVKSLGSYKTAGSAADLLPGIAAGTSVEYDMPLGYDRVKPTTADTLAAFGNSDPALTVNKVGKGLCYFWTPAYPGLCHIASRWEISPNKFDFWPNVRELLAAMVKGGLAYQKTALPVEVSGVPTEVEVTVRRQPGQDRMMIHLLDYDTTSSGVNGALLTVHPPEGQTVKRIFYPDTGTEVKFAATAEGLTAQLRNFEVHDMIVVQF